MEASTDAISKGSNTSIPAVRNANTRPSPTARRMHQIEPQPRLGTNELLPWL